MAIHRDAAMKPARAGRSRSGPVKVEQVNRRVWARARQVSNGRADLLRIIDVWHVAVLDRRYDPPR